MIACWSRGVNLGSLPRSRWKLIAADFLKSRVRLRARTQFLLLCLSRICSARRHEKSGSYSVKTAGLLYLTSTMMTRPLLQTYTPFPFPFVQGERDRVLDAAGRYYFDFYGGHCVCSTGHSHPHVVAAIAQQAKKLLFYSTAADIPVRHEAAEALIQFANSCEDSHLESVFFCNTGSEANENALKLAVKMTGRYRFAAFDGGLARAWNAAAFCHRRCPNLSEAYTPFLVPCTRLRWNDEAQLDAFDFSQVAAVILEPIQSMAGVRVAAPGFLAKLREVTAAAGALLILDEVQTGMGRLGQPYAAGR